MKRKLAFVLVNLGIILPPLAAIGDKQQVEATSTERVGFAAGGVIRVLHTFGSLNVEGWDRPEVEITVLKSIERYYEPKQRQQAAHSLERVRIVVDRRSDTEMTISTILPAKFFARLLGNKGGLIRGTGASLDRVTGIVRHPLGGKGGLLLEYQIRVPRDSRLVIQHGPGSIFVSNVNGDVQATSSGGDILLLLPDSGTYSIDAKSKLGTVSSDFEGASHRRHIVGSGFARATPLPSPRIYIRTGIGGITIKAVSVEAQAPPAARPRS